jgi:integrase
MLLSDAFDLYARRKLRDGKDSTLNQFRMSIQKFGRYLGRPATTDDLTNETVEDVMYWMKRGGDKHVHKLASPRTCNKFRDNIQALWTFLAKNGHMTTFPVINKFKEPTRIPFAWSQAQLAELFDATSRVDYFISGIPGRIWWRALCSVFYDSAERIGGVMTLEWQNINWESGFAIVRAEGRKGGRADKAHKLHANTMILLREMRRLRPDADRVFEWDRAPTHIYSKYKKILADANLPTRRECMFHCLRKTAASHFHAVGGDATELLGHADRRTTLKYLDPTVGERPHACDLMPRPANVSVALFAADIA